MTVGQLMLWLYCISIDFITLWDQCKNTFHHYASWRIWMHLLKPWRDCQLLCHSRQKIPPCTVLHHKTLYSGLPEMAGFSLAQSSPNSFHFLMGHPCTAKPTSPCQSDGHPISFQKGTDWMLLVHQTLPYTYVNITFNLFPDLTCETSHLASTVSS